jgi:hypothetical protein
MGEADVTETVRTRRLERVAVIAGIALVILLLVAVGIYMAFVILAAMMG